MKAEDLEAEVKITIDDIDQWGHVQGEVDVYPFDEEDLQQYKRAIIESQLQALKEEVGKLEEMLNTLKSDHLELVANRADSSEVREYWEEVLNLITNLKDK